MLGNVPEVLFWMKSLNTTESFCFLVLPAWRSAGLEVTPGCYRYQVSPLCLGFTHRRCEPTITYSKNWVCMKGLGRDTDPDRLETALQGLSVLPPNCLQCRLHFPDHHCPSGMRLAESKRKIHFSRQSSLSATVQVLWEGYRGRPIFLSSPHLRGSESWNGEMTAHNLASLKSSQSRLGILAHALPVLRG